MFMDRSIKMSVLKGLTVVFLAVTSKLPPAAAVPNQPLKVHSEDAPSSYCCALLRWRLKGKVVFPDAITYQNSQAAYWSLQESFLMPSCIVRPESTQDVSAAVSVLTSISRFAPFLGEGRCSFAIRSGGHTPFAGSANIDKGVTIDLGLLNSVTVQPNRTITSIGPGANWGNVYRTLEPLGLSVPGGRVSDVGVGGLTTGGGLSFFGPRYGLVCDNVENFEVVLASGEIVQANSKERSDLWYALKGGSNNFGIVTRFDMRTFRQGPFWGGLTYYPIETRLQHFQLLEQFLGAYDYDEYSTQIHSLAFGAETDWVMACNYEHTQPVVAPASLRPFTDVQPQLGSTMRISNLSNFTDELVSAPRPGPHWRSWATLTVGNDAQLFEEIFQLSNDTLQGVRMAENLQWIITIQGVVEPSRSASRNPLGLDRNAGPVVVIQFIGYWTKDADSAPIQGALRQLTDRVADAARQRNLLKDWIYLNYAAEWQDVFAGYGVANRARLRQISRRYDPRAVFQRDVPGGFKLFSSSDRREYDDY